MENEERAGNGPSDISKISLDITKPISSVTKGPEGRSHTETQLPITSSAPTGIAQKQPLNQNTSADIRQLAEDAQADLIHPSSGVFISATRKASRSPTPESMTEALPHQPEQPVIQHQWERRQDYAGLDLHAEAQANYEHDGNFDKDLEAIAGSEAKGKGRPKNQK